MQSGLHLNICALLVTLHAVQGYEDLSSKLDRLDRLFTDQQTQIEWLKKENQELRAAVKDCKQEARSSDHPGDDQPADTSGHIQRARSDDGGPLEVVVNRLARDITQLSGKVQAMSGKLQPLPGDLQALSGDVQALKNSDADRGSTFIHWGSSTCSPSSQLVYGGVLGGSHYTHPGSGANPLCLTMSPKLQDPRTGVPSFTLLYGGEYETADSHNNEAPACAMCWSPLSSTKMIPGTNDCPRDWTVQYSGYIMSGFYNHAGASEFICVDTKEEGLPGTGAVDSNGHLLYYTKTVCGSLPCGPYVNDKLVTCVVCSK